MTRTRALPLIVLAVIGGIAALLLQLALGAAGMPKITPQVPLSVTLVLIGVIVVVLALPVRRAVRLHEHARVDPFYATRVVLIAKASALSGALFAGAAIGLLIELLGRPVVTTGAIWGVVVMLIASLALMIAGLVAEAFCVVPPDDDDPGTGPTATP